jgi:hypothetical protein
MMTDKLDLVCGAAAIMAEDPTAAWNENAFLDFLVESLGELNTSQLEALVTEAGLSVEEAAAAAERLRKLVHDQYGNESDRNCQPSAESDPHAMEVAGVCVTHGVRHVAGAGDTAFAAGIEQLRKLIDDGYIKKSAGNYLPLARSEPHAVETADFYVGHGVQAFAGTFESAVYDAFTGASLNGYFTSVANTTLDSVYAFRGADTNWNCSQDLYAYLLMSTSLSSPKLSHAAGFSLVEHVFGAVEQHLNEHRTVEAVQYMRHPKRPATSAIFMDHYAPPYTGRAVQTDGRPCARSHWEQMAMFARVIPGYRNGRGRDRP